MGCRLWGRTESGTTEVMEERESTILWISVHSSSGILLTRSSPLNLFITSTANSNEILFKSCLAGIVFFLVFFSLSLNFAMRS